MSNRIYYAIHQVGIKEDGDTGAFDDTDVLHGVQSIAGQPGFYRVGAGILGSV